MGAGIVPAKTNGQGERLRSWTLPSLLIGQVHLSFKGCLMYFVICIWALSREKLSSGIANMYDCKHVWQKLAVQPQAWNFGYRNLRDIILSRQRTTKALIRLRGCAGWSAPLLFAYGINRFSHDVAHFISDRNSCSKQWLWSDAVFSPAYNVASDLGLLFA